MAETKAVEFTVPAGFSYKGEETEVGDIKYPLEFLQADTLKAWQDHFTERGLNVDDTIRDLLNELQKQRATQGGKQGVRTADADKKDAAIATHQAASRKYLLKGARTRTGQGALGLTQAKQKDLGAAVAEAMAKKGGILTQAEMAEIAKNLGITIPAAA